MTPMFSQSNATDSNLANAIDISQFPLKQGAIPYEDHVFGCDVGFVEARPHHLIVHVVGGSAEPEVSGIDAGWPIAIMENMETVRNGADMDFVADAGGQFALLVDSYFPVSVRGSITHVIDASVGTGRAAASKALFQRNAGGIRFDLSHGDGHTSLEVRARSGVDSAASPELYQIQAGGCKAKQAPEE